MASTYGAMPFSERKELLELIGPNVPFPELDVPHL